MIERLLKSTLKKSLDKYPVVGLIGCRQVGKTTLAKMIAVEFPKALYLDLELPSDIAKLQDPELYFTHLSEKLIIIDEIQRMPELFPILRAIVDRNRNAKRFLLLGSASPDLIKKSSESLAGRIVYHELNPLNMMEAGFENIQKLWLRGGLPLSFLSENDGESLKWREAFIRTYLERDIPQLGIHIPSTNLRRFWMMIAHTHGYLWNASQIAKSLGLSAPTIRNYLDILTDTFIVRQLQPYHINIRKRLVKSQKVYIRDSGLLHALLRIESFEDLLGHPIVGRSWEGFLIEQISNFLPEHTPIYFYRTSAGAEIDLLVLDRKNRAFAFEIKYTLNPKLEKGFLIAFEDLNCKKGFVIYPGEESYPLKKEVFTLPVRMLPEILSGI